MKRTARDVAKAVGRDIRCARELRAARQIDIAKASGISASMLSLIEAGKRMPSAPLCLRLADVLRCDYAVHFRPREGAK